MRVSKGFQIGFVDQNLPCRGRRRRSLEGHRHQGRQARSSLFFLRNGQGKDEYPVAEIGPPDFRSQSGWNARGPTASAESRGHGDVLFALGQICDRKSLCRSGQPCMPQDLSARGIIGVHVAVPIPTKHDAARRRKRSGIRRRRGALAPQEFPGLAIHGGKLTEIASRLGMLIIRAFDGTRSAFADYFLNRPECSLLARQIHGNIKSTSLRVVRHCSPALESGGAWAHIQFDSQLRNLAWKVCDFPGLGIYLNNRLVTEIHGVNELAVGSIELPEDSKLTHFEERLPSTNN